MNETYKCEANLIWNSGNKGKFNSPFAQPEIDVVKCTEFSHGIKEAWTPGHLFVAAVNSCLMSAFFLIVSNSNISVMNAMPSELLMRRMENFLLPESV